MAGDRHQAAAADEDIAPVLPQSSHARHGEQTRLSDFTRTLRPSAAVPGMVSEAGSLLLA